MKKLIILSIAIVSLSSCGHDYYVRSVDTNRIIYMDGSEIGQDNKVGDTIRMNGTQRIDSITIVKTQFTGVVISVDSKN